MIRAYGLGSLVGGTAIGAVVVLLSGLLTWLPEGFIVIAIPLAAATALARDFGLVVFPLPQNGRLVPLEVVQQSPGVAGLQFGFEMGTGVRTFVTSSSPYLLALTALLISPLPWLAVCAGTAFGGGRFAMPLFRYLTDDAGAWDEKLRLRTHTLVVLSAVLCAIAATWLALE